MAVKGEFTVNAACFEQVLLFWVFCYIKTGSFSAFTATHIVLQ